MNCTTPGSLVLHYLQEVCSNSCPLSQWCCLTVKVHGAPHIAVPYLHISTSISYFSLHISITWNKNIKLTTPSPNLGEGNGTALQYSCLETPMDRGAWWPAVHRVAKSWTRLSDFTFTFHFPALGKEMATHSSVHAWRIPGMGEPGGLLSMGLHRVRHDWSDLAAAAAATAY